MERLKNKSDLIYYDGYHENIFSEYQLSEEVFKNDTSTTTTKKGDVKDKTKTPASDPKSTTTDPKKKPDEAKPHIYT